MKKGMNDKQHDAPKIARSSYARRVAYIWFKRMEVLRIDIESLISDAQKLLLAAIPCPVTYVDRVALEKNKLPPTLGTTPINLYALWKRAGDQAEWELMYIGQRSYKSGWSRVAQHLFSTPQGTQSKLQEVRAAIRAGDEIGVTAILVEPDSMRLSVEEELINRNSSSTDHLRWNHKARSRIKKRRNSESSA